MLRQVSLTELRGDSAKFNEEHINDFKYLQFGRLLFGAHTGIPAWKPSLSGYP